MFVKTRNFSPAALERFRRLQQQSFAILERAAASLEGGETEKDVARGLVRDFRAAGVKSFFHLPVVLFGERTALPGDWSIGSFFPTSRALADGDSVILDAAPLFDGYLVDTSYSFCFGENAAHRDMMVNLSGFRDRICADVNEGRSFKAIADDVARDIRDMGYEAVHTKHPGEVLGHRAVKTPRLPFTWRLSGFDAPSLGWFILKGKAARRGLSRSAPTWNGHPESDHAPHDGLWLVEPHAGAGPVGAKWEEILVIHRGRAEWLDNDPPHVRQWRQIEGGGDYGPVRNSRH